MKDIVKIFGSVEIKAMDSKKGKLPTFSMIAYAGNPIIQECSSLPIIIDVESVIISSQHIAILRDHDEQKELGHTEHIFAENGLIKSDGIFSVEGEETDNVINPAKNGFPWQVSVRGPFDRSISSVIQAGETAFVNGRVHEGPALIARGMVLKEISILTLGADDQTSLTIAAKQEKLNNSSKEEQMKSDEIKAAELKKAAEIKAAKEKEEAEIKAQEIKDAEIKAKGQSKLDDEIKASDKAYAENLRRRAGLEKVCSGNTEILAQAMEMGWSVDKAELEVLRSQNEKTKQSNIQAGWNQSFNINPGSSENIDSLKVLEISAAYSLGVDEKTMKEDARFSEAEIEAASKRGHVGLREVVEDICRYKGIATPRRYGQETIKAAYSTNELAGIYDNALNKKLLMEYRNQDPMSGKIASISSLPDFKQAKQYRVSAAVDFLPVGDAGKLQSGSLSDESYTQQLDTFGRFVSLTRKDLINDDLGSLRNFPRFFARAGINHREEKFWALVAASAFFTAGNNNYKAGSTTALSSTSLGVARTGMRSQKNKAGKPINIFPKYLVVPPALELTALQLVSSTEFNNGASGDAGKTNPHFNKYEVVVVPWIAADQPGGSDTAWYLFAGEGDVPAYDIAYLNDQQAPTVSNGEKIQGQLGLSWEGFHDIGVAEADHRAGYKMKGIA